MKIYGKIIVDFAMSLLLLLLMAYELIGAAAHEWLGIALFLLVIFHHMLNRKWSENIFRGKYQPMRILQAVLVILVFLTMLGSMVSGIVISRHALVFLPIPGGAGWARTVHMLSAYWGFVLMGIHLGLHWGIVVGLAGRNLKPFSARAFMVRLAGILAAVYGAYAFIKRGLPGYMLLQNQFVFFDFEEPLALFLIDYFAIMALFVWVGYFLMKAARLLGLSKKIHK